MLHCSLKPLPAPDLKVIRDTVQSPGYLRIIACLEAEEAVALVDLANAVAGDDASASEDHLKKAKSLRNVVDTLVRIGESTNDLGSVELAVHTSKLK